MATIDATVWVGVSLAEAWDLYFDLGRWPEWVDGFGSMVESGNGYPAAEGTLVWRSIPAGRGEVHERVLAHEHRRLHRTEQTDPAMVGELETRFEIEGEGTRVSQTLSYRLLARGPIAWLGGLLFVRGQVRASLHRSLTSFAREAEEAAGSPA